MIRRLSLRWRVAAAFGVGLALVMTVLAVATWNLTTGYMLDQREQSVTRQSEVNVRLVDAALADDSEGLEELLTGLATGPDSSILLSRPAGWLTSGRQIDPAIVPTGLLGQARTGVAARQRFFASGIPVLGVATPVGGDGSVYVELYPLVELDRAFRYLSTLLITGTVMAALFGVGLGAWTARRALRPLTALTAAASRVARGDLSARLPDQADPDLAPLATSFNTTAGQLEQRVRRDARFASDVSHELRSPLTTMVNVSEVLERRQDAMPETAQRALRLLRSELRRFQRMVVDLLEISRADQDEGTGSVELVDLGELVRNVIDSRPPSDVRLEIDTDPLLVSADRRRIDRVVANLLDNADHYGGGAVAVTVERRGDRARIVVDDTGSGVPPALRERIFERFARGLHAARRDQYTGSGLGLAIVADHVHRHDGHVWVEDRPGGGARFVVELPEATG
ncbi:two-component system histidine kinase [Amycolatopsis mediterranei S699]|uniref:histidine kinase n=2 Tax=Amycolatopsis mediterranei TaxID=33910 RepID=A0A0H3DBM8_AMYMU|nr:HAMP domain-containing sensor histidine kinase [Amycolatopsis mediterranei]ADJ47478.1 two-component system histidine kinase [Amycolatopsis mediterranei U32]AEK44328.1 two-component system histidine kinase [Amycolatopsis mediterranei S699]AFO79189.1 two-component system histidine kinase [Amycolatopsis mediterranei S699]AGT86317.1 two-component system histidine kinase [Amycolatopsis mediterranei RB]KDO12596.1 histidine kinase [Amycolatopsis mediterranei]